MMDSRMSWRCKMAKLSLCGRKGIEFCVSLRRPHRFQTNRRLGRTVRANNRPFPVEIRARMNHNCDQPAAAANMSANEAAWPERLP